MGEPLLDFPRSVETFEDPDEISNGSLFDLMFLSSSS